MKKLTSCSFQFWAVSYLFITWKHHLRRRQSISRPRDLRCLHSNFNLNILFHFSDFSQRAPASLTCPPHLFSPSEEDKLFFLSSSWSILTGHNLAAGFLCYWFAVRRRLDRTRCAASQLTQAPRVRGRVWTLLCIREGESRPEPRGVHGPSACCVFSISHFDPRRRRHVSSLRGRGLSLHPRVFPPWTSRTLINTHSEFHVLGTCGEEGRG